MTEADVPAADVLRQLAGWNQTPADWLLILTSSPDGSFVAEEGGEVIGVVATVAYGREMAWIGMMLVHPSHRRKGLGSQLMRRAIDHLHSNGVDCIKLDATPLGRPVYERLGFLPEQTLTRWRRPPSAASGTPSESPEMVRSFDEAALPAVTTLDASAFGAPRPRLLQHLAGHALRVLTVFRGGDLEGFGMLRPGDQADHLGPMACSDAASASVLLPPLLQAAEYRAVVWDLPDANAPAIDLAKRFDFAPARLFTRMYLGRALAARDPMKQFAIADPSLG